MFVSDEGKLADSARRRAAVIAYTEYPWDPRVRRESEALVEAGYDVHAVVLRSRQGGPSAELNGVRIHSIPLVAMRGGKLRYAYQYTLFAMLSAMLLLHLHLRRPFCLVHVHSLPDFEVFSALPLKALGVALLLDLHEAMPEIVAARFHLSMNSLWVRTAALLEQMSSRFADYVITANEGIRAAVIARGFPEKRISAVYNSGAAPESGPVPPGEVLRLMLNLPGGPLLVHAGGINPERDMETLIRAIARLPKEADIHLVVAGDGDRSYLEGLSALVQELGLSERVLFVGRLPRAQAIGLMSLSAVGVVTLEANPLTELCWPTRVMEFAELRKPLVVPRLSWLKKILGNSARYYSPGDPDSLATELSSAMSPSRESDAAVAKAYDLCRRFGWNATKSTMVRICLALGESHGR